MALRLLSGLLKITAISDHDSYGCLRTHHLNSPQTSVPAADV